MLKIAMMLVKKYGPRRAMKIAEKFGLNRSHIIKAVKQQDAQRLGRPVGRPGLGVDANGRPIGGMTNAKGIDLEIIRNAARTQTGPSMGAKIGLGIALAGSAGFGLHGLSGLADDVEEPLMGDQDYRPGGLGE